MSISKTLIPGRGVALKWEGRNGGVSLLEDGKNVAKPKKGSNTGLFFFFFGLHLVSHLQTPLVREKNRKIPSNCLTLNKNGTRHTYSCGRTASARCDHRIKRQHRKNGAPFPSWRSETRGCMVLAQVVHTMPYSERSTTYQKTHHNISIPNEKDRVSTHMEESPVKERSARNRALGRTAECRRSAEAL